MIHAMTGPAQMLIHTELEAKMMGPVQMLIHMGLEASLEVHGLVQRLAKARLEIMDQQPGPRGPARGREAQLASLVSWVRRQLSFLAVQQQQRLLLGRLQLLGDGAREADRRRDWAVRMEAVAVRERQAQAVCLQQGRSICRSGFGLLQ